MSKNNMTTTMLENNNAPTTAAEAVAAGAKRDFGLEYNDVKGLSLPELERLVRIAAAKLVAATNEADNLDRRYSYEAWAEQRKREKYEVLCRAENAQGDLWLAGDELVRRKYKLENAKVQRLRGGKIRISIETIPDIFCLFERQGCSCLDEYAAESFYWCFIHAMAHRDLPDCY